MIQLSVMNLFSMVYVGRDCSCQILLHGDFPRLLASLFTIGQSLHQRHSLSHECLVTLNIRHDLKSPAPTESNALATILALAT